MEASTQFLKLLSIEPTVPIEVIAGVLPQFVECLDRHDQPQLQFVAACALTRIVSESSEHAQEVVEHGVVPKFVQLLNTSGNDVQEQALWALGNIAGKSPIFRDLVLSHGALMALLALVHEHSKLSMLRAAAWTLVNFCSGNPPAPFEQVKPALRALEHLVCSTDEKVLTNACWALSYLSDGTNDKIQAVIEAGVCPRIVQLLLHPSSAVVLPALLTIGNIVSGDDAQTQLVIDNQGIPYLHKLLTQDYEKSIKKEACWTISNITMGNRDQIQAVIEANIIAPIVFLLQHAEFEIKKEAAWAISNAAKWGSREQIGYLVSEGCIKPLCDLLDCGDTTLVIECMEGLENILKMGKADKELDKGAVNKYAQIIDECGGLDKIVRLLLEKADTFPGELMDQGNIDMVEMAVRIFVTYCVEEAE